ncbi:MAG: hypothetical protein IJW16_00325 [Clostridia bacterium]|nr:hypothetical protein [Clostridia bacterium]
MKKRFCMLLALMLAMILAGCSGCSGCNGCSSCSACSSAPALETVYDRIVELIEGSKEINTVLYGAGLPVYGKDSKYADYQMIYGEDTHAVVYEYVSEFAKFRSDTEIKTAAEKIYTAECLAPFYSSAFDGLAISDSQNGMVVAKARYDVGSAQLRQLSNMENGLSGMRIYDYSTIEIINPSTADLFRIQVDTWLEDTPWQIEQVTLSFALAEDGQWYLNTFTG